MRSKTVLGGALGFGGKRLILAAMGVAAAMAFGTSAVLPDDAFAQTASQGTDTPPVVSQPPELRLTAKGASVSDTAQIGSLSDLTVLLSDDSPAPASITSMTLVNSHGTPRELKASQIGVPMTAPITLSIVGGNENFAIVQGGDQCTNKSLGTTSQTKSCTVQVRANASTYGSLNGLLKVQAGSYSAVVPLSGRARNFDPARINISVLSGSPGNTAVRGPGSPAYSEPVILLLSNPSQELATDALSLGFTGANTNNYEIVNGTDQCSGKKIAPGESCQLSIRALASTAAAQFSAQFAVANHNKPTLNLIGSATSFAPANLLLVSGSGSGLDVSNASSPGECRIFTLRNTGDFKTGPIVASLTNGATYFDVGGCENTCTDGISGGMICTIGVRPVASDDGSYSGLMRLAATPGGSVAVNLTGTASGFTCAAPWGAQIKTGTSVVAWSAANPMYPTLCQSETRVCSKGQLSGSFGLQSCVQAYTYAWQTDNWGNCSTQCGGGNQTRVVSCIRSDGQRVADSFCGGDKPDTTQSCNTQLCYSYAWNSSDWSACTVNCGGGTQTRTVTCRRSDGQTVDNSFCAPLSQPPSSSQTCNTTQCMAQANPSLKINNIPGGSWGVDAVSMGPSIEGCTEMFVSWTCENCTSATMPTFSWGGSQCGTYGGKPKQGGSDSVTWMGTSLSGNYLLGSMCERKYCWFIINWTVNGPSGQVSRAFSWYWS